MGLLWIDEDHLEILFINFFFTLIYLHSSGHVSLPAANSYQRGCLFAPEFDESQLYPFYVGP